jgi:hypothetical protein
MILSNLQANALQTYYNAKLALDSDTEAYQKAAQAIASELAQAGVTGTYQGQPTQQAIKQLADIAAQQASTMVSYAQQFGVWGTPQQGQQTLAGQKQGFDEANTAAQLTGWYTPYSYTPPTGGSMPGATSPSSAGGLTADQMALLARNPSLANPAYQQVLMQSRGWVFAPGESPSTLQQAAAGWNAANNTFDPSKVQVAPAPSAAGGNPMLQQYPPGTVVRTAGNQFGVVGPNGTVTPGDASNPAIYQAIQAGQGIMTVPDAAFAQAASPVNPATVGTQPSTVAGTPTGAPPGYENGQPIQTLAGNQQAFQQQIDAQKQALAQWQAQQTAAQNYLSMMTNLRGPADYAKYQQVLGATPGGMKDLVAAAAGQYIPGGGATTGVAPTPVDLNSFVGSATGTQDPSSQAAMNSLVAPNQMAPQTWNALTPSQQQMLLGTWEAQGYNKDDAQALFNQSLPKYATNSPSSGSFKLQ